MFDCHKAPSGKRCIKTACCVNEAKPFIPCHRAPSAKRCIKTSVSLSEGLEDRLQSEST